MLVKSIDASHANLREIPIDQIDRNPENPRIIFRPGELEDLLASIRRYGVQVPVSVYREGKRFVLIDGERRWRCALKLNKKTIPALIQEKPDPLTNLLLMFNIHALREQWDLLTIAVKLPRIIELLEGELGRSPNERELSDRTGLTRGAIRRSRLLMELPEQHKDQILNELNKPKTQQRLTEDFFIEMERSLTTVERAIPGVIESRDRVRDVLIEKYRKGVIRNITDFRKVSKIARAERVAADTGSARFVLRKVFEPNQYSIDDAYKESVSEAYSERDLLTHVRWVMGHIANVRYSQLEPEVRSALQELFQRLASLIPGRQQ